MKLILTVDFGVDFGVESLKPRAKRSYRYATWHHENLHNAFRMQVRAANTYTTTEIALSAAQFLIVQTPCSFLHVPSPCKDHTAFGPRLRTAGIFEANFHTARALPTLPPLYTIRTHPTTEIQRRAVRMSEARNHDYPG
jgi:hypothetical protein